jgi:hypothetical protein
LTSSFTSLLVVDDNRPVGLANDVFGDASVIPRRLGASGRSSIGPSATSFSSQTEVTSISTRRASIRTSDTAENLQEPDDPAILFELSGLQNCNGGFGPNAAKVIVLVQPLCPGPTKDIMSGLEEEMVAALLALLWMTLWCGIAAMSVTEKVKLSMHGSGRTRLLTLTLMPSKACYTRFPTEHFLS